MEDIDKTRIEYVARLEQQVAELHRQLSEAQPLAEKWTPVVSGELMPDGEARVTLCFGGKRVTATVTGASFRANNVHDLTFSITNTLAESLLVEKISEVIKPEVERLFRGATAMAGAGKW